jgi:hypothetical protein
MGIDVESRESIKAALVKTIPWTTMERHGEKIYAQTA